MQFASSSSEFRPIRSAKLGHVTFIWGRVKTNLVTVAKMSSLPSEKLSELRQVIHGHISNVNVQEKIRTCLSEALAQEGGR